MRFYALERPIRHDTGAITDYSRMDSVRLGDAPQCPTCGGWVGMMRCLPPIQVELELWGPTFGDVAWGTGDQLLVSEAFKNAFQTEGLTGFDSFTPVEATRAVFCRGRISQPTPRYFMVLRSHSRAAIDDKASGVVRRDWSECKECLGGDIERCKRVVLEPGTWSGEDVFVARGFWGRILTSQRFKDFCDRHRFKNIYLIDTARYDYDGERVPPIKITPPGK